MNEYMTLLGAEDVSRAASSMRVASEQMGAAASNMEAALERHQRFLDDWLYRLEEVIEKAIKSEGG